MSLVALMGSWGKCARDWSVNRGGLEIKFGVPERVHEGQVVILLMHVHDFRKYECFEGGLQAHEFKDNGLCALKFHGALRERVFSLCWRWGVPLERPRLAPWQIMMDTATVFDGFAFRLERS